MTKRYDYNNKLKNQPSRYANCMKTKSNSDCFSSSLNCESLVIFLIDSAIDGLIMVVSIAYCVIEEDDPNFNFTVVNTLTVRSLLHLLGRIHCSSKIHHNKSKRMTSSSSQETTNNNVNLLVLLMVIVASIIFGIVLDPPTPFTKKDLLRGLRAVVENETSLAIFTTAAYKKSANSIVLGLNANLDGIVSDGPGFLTALKVDEHAAGKDHDKINTLTDIGETFNHYFSSSAAAERSVESQELWDNILKTTQEVSMVTKIGGNAALMSEALYSVFQDRFTAITLIGMIGEEIASKLKTTKVILESGKEGSISTTGGSFPVRKDELYVCFSVFFPLMN